MITIIGAGPAGNYAAYLLARKNKEVKVFEEHKDIGLPVQCTGITTNLLKDIMKLKKDTIMNEISKARIFSPDKKFIEINLHQKDIILDRNKFDNQIADMAKQQGAKFFLSHKYIGNKKNKNIALIKDKEKNKTKKIEFSHLIGADGPLSKVAKSNSMFNKREFWQGIQARVKMKNDNIIEFYPSFGTYAWVVPENKDITRVGLVSKRYANLLFKNFLFKFKEIKQKDIIEYQAGIIPKYNPNIKTQKNNIYLVGDAACQVKATTGGGIIQGMIAARALSNSIINNKDYEAQWKKMIGRDLYAHLLARNMMDKFRDKDWIKLINTINSNKDILETHKRDNIFMMMLRLLIKNPGLLYFAKYLI